MYIDLFLGVGMSDTLTKKYGRHVEAGEILFHAGDTGEEMFVIRSGSVRVYIEAAGHEKTLAILGSGEFVGEMSLLTGKPRTANAQVHETGELLSIKGRVLEEMIVHNTEIALRLIKRLAKRLEATDSLVAVLIHRDAKERVIENLKRLADLHGWTPGEEVTIAADIPAMAEQVGLDMDEVYDVISRLVKAGALVETDCNWTIKDPDRLGEFLSFLKKKEQFR
jgi:CRP/FNR family transcriptional regulator, cyclic AMP receptor protein